MRIAVYHNLSSGGAKRSLLEMVRGLAPRHEVDAFTLSCGEHDFADIRPYVRQHDVTPFTPGKLHESPYGRLNQLVYWRDLQRLDRVDQQVAQRIDAGGYDVAFIHHCRYRQSPAVLRYLQTPTVYYCQEPPRKLYDPPILRPYETKTGKQKQLDKIDPLPGLYERTLRLRDQKNVRHAHTILVNSAHSRELIWRVYQKEPVLCYLGVDTQEFQPVDIAREMMVLSVGTVNPIKGYDLLVKALGLVPEGIRPYLMIISNFSDDREIAYLETLAGQNQVNLQFHPLISDSRELASWYSRALITGYTPVLEPLGLVSLESMACGTPVLGVREGGVRETVLDGITGVLVDRSPQLVANALIDLLQQPQKVTQMGQQGRNWVEQNWGWQRTVACAEEALQQACR